MVIQSMQDLIRDNEVAHIILVVDGLVVQTVEVNFPSHHCKVLVFIFLILIPGKISRDSSNQLEFADLRF
jgi:hypothetical protein